MNIHYLQHVPYEGLGCIEDWAHKNNCKVTCTRFYENQELPSIHDFDWLIVMGGPMGVYDDGKYPWLEPEKEFIQQAISEGKIVLGICLGSQLIAAALGSKVYPNAEKEIGWFSVKKTEFAREINWLKNMDEEQLVFHWHGDTFNLPEGSAHLMYSDVCHNQAYLINDRIMGLQFHFEVTENSLNEMIRYGHDELIDGKYIQTENKLLAFRDQINRNNRLMHEILDGLAQSNNL